MSFYEEPKHFSIKALLLLALTLSACVGVAFAAWTMIQSPQVTVNVLQPDPTTLSIVPSATAINLGQSVSFVVTLDQPINANVQLYMDGAPVGTAQPIVAGTATLTATPPIGSHTFYAVATP